MTTAALAPRFPLRALACMEGLDCRVGDTQVRGFSGSRARFVMQLALDALNASHIIYDFAGTARAHVLLKFHRKPCAIWAHGWEIWGTPRADYTSALHHADLVLVNSKFTLERGADTLRGARNVRVCGLATYCDDVPESVGPSAGPPTVLLLGRTVKSLAKGHDLLISLWPKVVDAVPDARLVFAGGGDALGHIRSLAASSSAAASIDVLGFVPAEDIEGLWKKATVFAMPAFGEGFGIVYIEAMRHGIPIIASQEDAGQEVNRHDQTGFNISRQRPDEIAEGIVTLLHDRDLALRFGEVGHRLWQSEYCFSGFARGLMEATADFLAL